MTRCALFDDSARSAFFPFTYSRPLSELRFGILTLTEKWEAELGQELSWLTVPYLRDKFPVGPELPELIINGRSLPDRTLLEEIGGLNEGEGLLCGDFLLAAKPKENDPESLLKHYDEGGVDSLCSSLRLKASSSDPDASLLHRKWELFNRNGEALREDHERLKKKRSSAALSSDNALIGDHLFLEKGVNIRHATLNTESGPIYIDRDAEVMEGAMIRGPFYLGPHAVVKMGAKIYGPTTVGPYCKVGGEVNNSLFFGYSNKAHDGFLGNSVIGEWCNLGADTNNSNLKNNYGAVKVWDHQKGSYETSGLTFCGIFMGDHSKCGIDTMFNTGTTVGFSANIFDAGFPPKFLPSFFWGGSGGGVPFELEKAKEVAEKMRERRGLPFDATEERIFDAVYRSTAVERQGME
ncbi:MAG: GlmU family protein [Flavobacteriales bacterium]